MSWCCLVRKTTTTTDTQADMADVDSNSSRSHSADFQTIRTELLRTGKLFSDPDFPPPQSHSLYFDGRIPGKIGYVEWKRAKDMYRNPMFMLEGAQRHDLNQGYLGNCWFIAAAANLAVGEKKRFERVVPPDQDFGRNYAGIFHFNFWWHGEWTEVIVDDYLPTQNGSLIYCRNTEFPNEFWPALLEKAYAKLHGCYGAIEGGKPKDAMVDLTGGISEQVLLTDQSKLPPNLFQLLYGSHNMDSMQVAGLMPTGDRAFREVRRKYGLKEEHAYSITKFHQVPLGRGTVQLVRLRNPWGEKEWNGPWSDKSDEMRRLPEHAKKEMNVRIDDEGEFWMSYEDFVVNFDFVHLCHLQVDSLMDELGDNTKKQMWNVTRYDGEWKRNVSAGGANSDIRWTNPQFFVELKEPDTLNNQDGQCTLIVSLMQHREKDAEFSIGFQIYQLKTKDQRPLNPERAARNVLSRSSSGDYVNFREVTKRFELSPGHYVIMPSTFYPNEEARFLLRLFTEKFADSSVTEDGEDEAPMTLPVKDPVSELFHKYCGPDTLLNPSELQEFLTVVSEQDLKHRLSFSKEQCRSLLPLMNEHGTGRLDLIQAKGLWKEIKAYRELFLQFDKDRSNAVDASELSNMFKHKGLPVGQPVLTTIIQRYGDRDNRIPLEDFIVVIIRLIQLFYVYMKQERRSGRSGIAEFTRNEFLQQTLAL